MGSSFKDFPNPAHWATFLLQSYAQDNNAAQLGNNRISVGAPTK
jgi:hypothetical protein